MRKRKFGEGGVTDDELEIANKSEDPIASLNAQKGWTDSKEESAKEEPAKNQSFKEAFAEARKSGGKTFEWNGKKYTTDVASSAPAKTKATDTGDESARLAARAPKPALRQETMRDRAESYVAKRAAQRAEDAAKDTTPRGQDRILTGIKKKADENKLMGSLKLKSGGSVKPSKMGAVKSAKPSFGSASRRADGIAQRGKTRGKMC
jgi:hypothetical protein